MNGARVPTRANIQPKDEHVPSADAASSGSPAPAGDVQHTRAVPVYGSIDQCCGCGEEVVLGPDTWLCAFVHKNKAFCDHVMCMSCGVLQ